MPAPFRFHARLQVALWVVSTDVEVHASPAQPEQWGETFVPLLWQHGVVSLAKAKEKIEDYGDLREWQVPKEPAKQLFTSLSTCSSTD